MPWRKSKRLRRWWVLGLCALASWYATVWWGRVQAIWPSSLPTVGLSSFVIDSEDTSVNTNTLTLSLPSPGCGEVELVFTWLSDEQLLKKRSAQTLVWESSVDTVEFSVLSSCEVPQELVVETSGETFEADLPWGAARLGSQHTVAQAQQHVVPLHSSQPSEVVWFLPVLSPEYTLSLRDPPSFPSDSSPPSPPVLTPLLSQWWQTQVALPFVDCHTEASIFWDSATGPCQAGQVSYLQLQNRLSSVPVADFPLPQPGQVLMSEVNWAGSFRGEESVANDEWLELTNLTPEPLSLQGLQIEGARAGGQTLVLSEKLVLAPYGTVVIARLPFSQSQLQSPADWVTSHLSLSNTQARLILRSSDGTELDRTPEGVWQDGLNNLALPLRASAQRRLMEPFPADSWFSWRTCQPAESQEWCEVLANLAFSPGSKTFASPGMASPW